MTGRRTSLNSRPPLTAPAWPLPTSPTLLPPSQLIAAGKHVLMEKPLTTDVAEGEQLVAAARERGVKLMVNFSNRWNPKFLAAREAMTSARLGDFVMGYSRLSNTISVPTSMLAWASQSGPEWFLFPHTIDIVRWIVGREITQVYAAGRKGFLTALGIDAYDAIQAVVHFGDAFVTFETCWVIPNSWPSVVDSTMTLFGTAGRMEIDQNDQGITFAGERFETGAPYGRYDNTASHAGSISREFGTSSTAWSTIASRSSPAKMVSPSRARSPRSANRSFQARPVMVAPQSH